MIHSNFEGIWHSKKAGMQHLKIPQGYYNSSCIIQHTAFEATLQYQSNHNEELIPQLGTVCRLHVPGIVGLDQMPLHTTLPLLYGLVGTGSSRCRC